MIGPRRSKAKPGRFMERLRIEKVVHGGFGLARREGRVWLIPWTAPADLVEARAVREHRTWVEAECVSVLEPGPDRVSPRCPWYRKCGGCHLQHLAPEAQVRARTDILIESLRRVAGLSGLSPQVVTGNPWEYRSRVEFHVAASDIGFFARGTHDLVPIEDCWIAVPEIRRLIPELRRTIAEAQVPGPASIEAVVGIDRAVVLVCDGPPGWFTPRLPGLLMALPGVVGVWLHARARHWLSFGRASLRFGTSPDGPCVDLDPRGFSQANIGLNPQLVEIATRWVGANHSSILELYAGAGNFTLPLLRRDPNASLTAVESNRDALNALERAGRDLAPGRLTCIAADAEVGVRRLLEQRRRFDCILADPPRAGIGKTARLIPRFGATRIVLVSCEPMTLARDAGVLREAGYRVGSLALVDMFPQTAHVEAVLRMEADPDPSRS